MQFSVTSHAQCRLEERGIGLESIKALIQRPITSHKQQDGTVRAHGTSLEGKALTVVYKKEGKKYVIVTAY